MENNDIKTTVLAGGCFWCTEAVFTRLKGIISVKSGYIGGTLINPTYEQVSTGSTGHIEAIKIEYDSSVIAFYDLLTVFFYTHDPTTMDRQGADIGKQYRSVIFYNDEHEKIEVENFINDLIKLNAYDKPIVTELEPMSTFYDAEDYHEKYYENHKNDSYCEIVIAPKIEKLQKRFAELLK